MSETPFKIRGFNPCESLLRHTPEQLRTFIRRMKTLNMNTIILHYDYGWKRYQPLLLEECEKNGIEIILMTFGPRTFLSYTDWTPQWFAKKEDGTTPWTSRLECETYPCAFVPECLDAFEYGARQWLCSLPPAIKHVHMRAADGILFCQCEHCRNLPEHERWQPFVERFTKAVLDTRPDLKFESDVYVMRYNIPGNHIPFEKMNNIMFDTFYRSSAFPLGIDDDTCSSSFIPYAAGHTKPDAMTISRYHANRLNEWSRTFPGKVYIHENAMAQGLFGTFQHATASYLQDLSLYRKLGIQGVCYEAYEPGYANFSSMFELLARAMNGEEISHELTELEKYRRKNQECLFSINPDMPFETYFSDPFLLEQNRLFRDYWINPSLEHFRRYVEFAFEHEERMDPLFIGYEVAAGCLRRHVAHFPGISSEAQDFLTRRKLWDFMEDIPMSQDPRKICKDIIMELISKSVKN